MDTLRTCLHLTKSSQHVILQHSHDMWHEYLTCDKQLKYQVQWTLTYPNVKYPAARIIGLDLCVFYLTPMLHMEQSSCTRLLEQPSMRWNFDLLKPEKVKIRWLFAPTMDNMTGKEMAVLIIYIICMMIHISSEDYNFFQLIWQMSNYIQSWSAMDLPWSDIINTIYYTIIIL